VGQKVSPKALRLGYIEEWESRWCPFSKRETPDLIVEDFKIRKLIKEKVGYAGVSRIVIERAGKILRVFIHAARPGLVIGRHGATMASLVEEIEKIAGPTKKVEVKVLEIENPNLDAQLVAESIAFQIEKRIPHRVAMKTAIARVMSAGALGVKIMVSGRLEGNEIARFETLKEGRIPTSTFRAFIDYGKATAYNTYGVTGVKVWIFKKEFFKKSEKELIEEARLLDEKAIEEKAGAEIFEEEQPSFMEELMEESKEDVEI
jgi:small subunit ribosomal protein S3